MNKSQTTNTIFMIRPVNFKYNSETASSNSFQKESNTKSTNSLAQKEFDNYVKLLKDFKINVIEISDSLNPATPDSIFPNNWFSTHDGTLVLYPMCAQNRRLERKEIFLNKIKESINITKVIDLTYFEKDNLFLEGTGSLVLDRINKICYASLSIRTSENVIDEFCNKLGYKKIVFTSYDKNDNIIYHTNVMMNIGIDYSIICLDSIKDLKEREQVIKSLEKTNKTIINISLEQLDNYLGNALEIKNCDNERILIMSKTAYNVLTKEQLSLLNKRCKIITPSIPTIETNGGGSARCMIAELF